MNIYMKNRENHFHERYCLVLIININFKNIKLILVFQNIFLENIFLLILLILLIPNIYSGPKRNSFASKEMSEKLLSIIPSRKLK